ncbi:MAG TPA: pantoate--beta-alanine ligase [Thermomicrobiales bacterium]|nr:pantoate--beta-alanine ligase [Thermomicrobiales bacterium]
MPRVITTRAELRAALGDEAPGLVPTMGALHAGHAALIARSAAENSRTVVSIFVNPGQFSDSADLAAYPRDLQRDVDLAVRYGAELIFAPPVDEVYPPGFATAIEVAGVAEPWEGTFRPGHFRGVATVVTVLLNLVRPARSYFGEKDYQQVAVIRRIHADLALPGEIIACPTVRDADGLAVSSRNTQLATDERTRAAIIPRALFHMAELAHRGEHDAETLLECGYRVLSEDPELVIEYLAVVDGETLGPIGSVRMGARALLAVRLGSVRLIDNIALDAGGPPGEGAVGVLGG